MRNRRRVCLIMLCLMLIPLSTWASPSAGQAGCVIHLALSAETAYEEPWARWMNQLCGMAEIRVNAAQWEEGGILKIQINMGSEPALTACVAAENADIYLSSDLLTQRISFEESPSELQELLNRMDDIMELSQAGRLIPVSGAALGLTLSNEATRLRAMAATARARVCVECENCGICEECRLCELTEGLAVLIDAVGDRFDAAAYDKNVLLIDIDRTEGENLLPVTTSQAAAAPDDLGVRMIRDALLCIRDAVIADADVQ